jgi:hypothetical protein
MKIFETSNIWSDLIIGIIFLFIGGYLLLFRKNVIDALLLSNKVFWTKIGLCYGEKVTNYMTNIMIPLIGILFVCVGILLTYRAIASF